MQAWLWGCRPLCICFVEYVFHAVQASQHNQQAPNGSTFSGRGVSLAMYLAFIVLCSQVNMTNCMCTLVHVCFTKLHSMFKGPCSYETMACSRHAGLCGARWPAPSVGMFSHHTVTVERCMHALNPQCHIAYMSCVPCMSYDIELQGTAL